MTTGTEPAPPGVADPGEELMGRLFGALLGSLELATVQLGCALGLYAALDRPRTASGLAEVAGIHPRYAREWLEQQAIAGLVDVAEDGDQDTRSYVTNADQRAALAEAESPFYAASMAMLFGGVATALSRLPEVYRSGGGLSFGEFGDDVRLGQGLFNRGSFLGQLAQEWVPALPDVAALLSREGAVALDMGCGVGWSSIALAQAWPTLQVLGVDLDDASVMDARVNAARAGVADRVRFEVADAARPLGAATYDVAFFLECLHDMAHPVEALAATRTALKPDGRVVVMDERAEERFAPNGSEIERVLGTFSVLHCLPVGMSQPGSAGTGAMFRPDTMRRYAEEAGYLGTEVAPIEHDMFRFYVLTP